MTKTKNLLFSSRIEEKRLKFYAETFKIDKPFENVNLRDLFFTGCEVSGNSFRDTSFIKWCIKSSILKDFNFENSHFQECFGKHYLFQNCDFGDASFTNCDFSGGSYDQVNFSHAHFENCDFALCEFNGINFGDAKFIDCNFNASFFENVTFKNNLFQSSTFNYVEGLTDEQMNNMTGQGAKVSPPSEIIVKDFIIKSYKKINPVLKYIAFACLFILLGYNSQLLLSKISHIFKMEANPLSTPINWLGKKVHVSYFYNKLSLPNYNFSDSFDHWLFSHDKGQTVDDSKTLDYEVFSSFPSSLLCKSYQGKIFYIKSKKSKLETKDDLNNPDIWLPVDFQGEKLKFSFYYKNGHPKFSIYGKFIEGGYRILAEIDSAKAQKETAWIYFSEELNLPKGYDSLCLKLSNFPKIKLYLDDINIEKTI